MTNCAPIHNRSGAAIEFVGALCSDNDISGNIEYYFPDSADAESQYLLIDAENSNAHEIRA
jgi:hypothetical protein